MSDLYLKKGDGSFVPISFKQVVTKEWDGKFVIVRIGTEENPASKDSIDDLASVINDADALDPLEGVSFLITLHNVEFEVLESLKEVGEKYVAVRVTGKDDLNKLGELQNEARKQLRGKTKKVVILPTPLTVDDYREAMEIKHRCDIRKRRRGG